VFYGLCQTSRAWYENIDNFFKSLHMTKCKADPDFCLWHNEGNILFVTIYVDDLIITCDTKDGVEKEVLNDKFGATWMLFRCKFYNCQGRSVVVAMTIHCFKISRWQIVIPQRYQW
jgi:hypothetical protein